MEHPLTADRHLMLIAFSCHDMTRAVSAQPERAHQFCVAGPMTGREMIALQCPHQYTHGRSPRIAIDRALLCGRGCQTGGNELLLHPAAMSTAANWPLEGRPSAPAVRSGAGKRDRCVDRCVPLASDTEVMHATTQAQLDLSVPLTLLMRRGDALTWLQVD